MVPLIYHRGYNVTAFGLDRLHPFDGSKYRKIRDSLIARGLRTPADFVRPATIGRGELGLIHPPGYLAMLRDPAIVARMLELPIARRLPARVLDWRVLAPMRLACGGTLLAARLALREGVAINLGGGFHHASGDRGGGFCVYADVPIAAAVLHAEAAIERVLVVDLDAHQGDGTASAFFGRPWAAMFDLYQRDLFPTVKQPEAYPIPVGPGLTGPEYLDLVATTLPAALDEFRPDLVLYNAGSDPFIDDPLAGYRLIASDLADRDLMVVSMARERSIPIAMVLSGGYSRESWRIHADAIEGILVRFDPTT